MEKTAVTAGTKISTPATSEFRRIIRVFFGRKLALFGFVIIIIALFVAIFAPILSPYDPYKIQLSDKLLSPSWQHLLGTDASGRDVFSRLLYGARTSLMVGVIAVFMATIIGQPLGLIAGYTGGTTYTVIMRLIDSMMAIPMILLALIIGSLLGGGLKNVIIALGIGMIPVHARIMCGQAMVVKQSDYVTAARVAGASPLRVMLLEVLPNCLPPLIVVITMEMGTCILAEAGLSFLGLGIAPPGAAWGSMISDGYKYLLTNPILSFAPGLAVMFVVLSFNMAGDGLRDALDPRLRGTL